MSQPVTLITGASSGIGAELARVFARHGHAVALTARREDRLQQLAGEIATTGGKPAHVLTADLEAAGAAERLEQTLSERGLEPEIVVNNAGFGLAGNAADLDLAEQLKMIDLNARALTDLSLRFIDSLTRHRGGILNVASIASFMPGPGLAVYHATKAYVLSFGEALNAELKPRGVRVSTLCPGPVPTEFDARAGFAPDSFPRILERSAERVAREGYEGFMRGDRVIIPGTPNKAATRLARLLPAQLIVALADRRRH